MSNFVPIDPSEWNIANNCGLDAHLRESITAHVDPIELAKQLREQTKKSFLTQSKQRTVASYIEESSEKSGYARHCFVIAIESECVFNQFFNGQCGYRAMYLRSPTVGKEYNDFTIKSLFEYLQRDSKTRASLCGGSTKIWPFFENRFFRDALVIPKWKDSPLGIAAFDPTCPTFVIKGSFLNEKSEVHDPKPERDQKLHEMGYV